MRHRSADIGRSILLPPPPGAPKRCRCHNAVADWELRPGGALGRCMLCGRCLGALYIVLGDELSGEQAVWLTAALAALGGRA